MTTLASFQNPPNILNSFPATAPNRLLYSNIIATGSDPGCCNMFSIGATAGTEHTYPAENFAMLLGGNLPSGKLFGTSYNYATLANGLATVDTTGDVRPFYQFPSPNLLLAPPIYGADGSYYGTVVPSGTATTTDFYKVTPSGAFTLVATLPFGTTPFVGGGLVLQGSDGNFYGIQSTGPCPSSQHGAVYKLTPAGQYTILHDFGICGKAVIDSLIEGSDGKLYGATEGNNLLFSLTTSGDYKVLFETSNGSTQGICPCWLL